jgi:hydroxyacylglutathione hydrolase
VERPAGDHARRVDGAAPGVAVDQAIDVNRARRQRHGRVNETIGVLFERIEDKGLAQYSYVVGCERAGEVAVVDPRRDVDVYLDFVRARSLRITQVLETHIHADFASGALELATRTGAPISLSALDTYETYQVRFQHVALRDRDTVTIGNVRLQALHTPGHTPEHMSYLVFDGARSADHPMVLLSGDFLFVGSVGRPDLLGDAQTEALARKLYDSVRRVLDTLPDGLEIAPGHGAGSMCGAGMSGRPTSTLGFERIANPYLRAGLTEMEFVRMVLERVPPLPDYYPRMKALNAGGPPMLNGLPGLTAVPVDQVHRALVAATAPSARAAAAVAGAGAGAGRRAAPVEPVVIDLRDQVSFGAGHIPGAFGIGAGANVSTWASWVVPYERPLWLVAARVEDIEPAVRSLVRVGLDDVRGYVEGGMPSWIAAGYEQAHLPQIAPAQLAARLGDARLHVLDVRTDQEWDEGHIAGAQHIIAGELAGRLDDLPAGGTIVVACGTGYRSTVAASVLERAGRTDVINLTGGMAAWQAAALPLDIPSQSVV